MRKKYNIYSLPPWLRTVRAVAAQFSIPFCIFQGIRTIFFPTTVDVLLLTIFVLVSLALYLEII
ncbi:MULTISPECIES: hypothetical protein [unclassified Bacillus (in: firmicutes)]|uniref:hypothetical protein n=1 Tax=unclassified Bacillus (in: firmicutes) TaxID=185979 RepID=UPI0008F19647|nr:MULTISPECIES: hypothetical protein [unclassified Bacillus (in: firmicutes)]SFB16421.1 hypothetical protein SAMN02799634_10742 [Bacillus sp. UNCCL13]SFQ78051.1 hypothetical protein SAMN04488577_1597 [Bacillus sp. cl95]